MADFLRQAYGKWAFWLGGLPARRVIWSLTCLFSLWVLADVLVLRWTGGMAQTSYDAMVRSRLLVPAPDPRIVVIDIDEPSLSRMAPEFGRWPWPRDTLATVLDYIEQQQPAAIVWDIVFSDADRISPGGDAALDAAVRRSPHSHFPVVRLHKDTDATSAISRAVLPTLWAGAAPGTGPQKPSTVALIAPALPAIAAARLGYNNGYPDADGVLRRYRHFETLADGSTIQSIAMSALSAVDPPAYQRMVADLPATMGPAHQGADDLIAWRASASAYPHVPFADVFEAADSGRNPSAVPALAGKIVLIGSTAAALHDIHPTPLAKDQPGVDSLAAVIDNAVNHRHLRELPRWLNAVLAIALCIGLALWVEHRKISSLSMLILALPASLLFVSYLTLNGLPVFVDLHLSAGLALLFLACLRYWSQLRRSFWCAVPLADGEPWGMVHLVRDEPWMDEPLDRLIDLLERRLPRCRIIVPDVAGVTVANLQSLRWPELVRHCAIIGPAHDLSREYNRMQEAMAPIARCNGMMLTLPGLMDRAALARTALQLWSRAQETTTHGDIACQ